jgi:hypothetical protein
MRYSLWHLETGNVIGEFENEDAAIAAVREEVATNDDADQLMLAPEDPSAEPIFGTALADLTGVEIQRRQAAIWR